jgi:spore germination cell wall hydrolase CwlJ-like protein
MRDLFIITALVFYFLPSPPNKPERGELELNILPTYEKRLIDRLDYGSDPFDHSEINCLALAVYGEARGESLKGKIAVINVIMNRVGSRKFPNTICDVVLQDHQFESIYDNEELYSIAKDNQNFKFQRFYDWLENDSSTKIEILNLAIKGFHLQFKDYTHGSTHFYSPSVLKKRNQKTPEWTYHLEYTKQIGKHKFFSAK